MSSLSTLTRALNSACLVLKGWKDFGEVLSMSFVPIPRILDPRYATAPTFHLKGDFSAALRASATTLFVAIFYLVHGVVVDCADALEQLGEALIRA